MVKLNSLFVLVLFITVGILSISFVFAAPIVTNISSLNINEDTISLFNISINNTDADQPANITQVNITLWGNFIFITNNNGTDSPFETFRNTSSVLSWTNSTIFLINGTQKKFFWFNATASTPGTYNISVKTLNGNGTSSQTNLSVTVNDTTAPSSIDFNSPTPDNNTIVITTLRINVSVIDNVAISNITVNLFNSTNNLVNYSNSTSNFTATFTGLTGGAVYYYNVTVYDTNGNSNSTLTRMIRFAESSFEFNGTVRDSNGVFLNNTVVNISVSSMGNQGPTALQYYSANSNASGWFNVTLPVYSSWMYKPVLRHTNSTTSAIDYVGPTIPDFPYQEFSRISGVNFYLKQAGTINITAVNSTGNAVSFFYQVKDTKLGYPIAYDFTNYATEVNVYVPADRNYSVMVYPNQSLPVSFNWNNFTVNSSYNFGAEFPTNNLSRYNATTKTVHKKFNTTNTNIRLTGYANLTGIDGGFDDFKVVVFLVEPGNMVYQQYGILPYNMSAWAGQTDVYNLTTGYYNITVPGPAENQTILLFASARNGTSYYGSYKNVTVAYGSASTAYNFTTMYGLIGDAANFSLNNPTSAGTVNVSCKKQRFNILNSSNSTFTNTAHVEATVDYSSYGAMEFTFMEDVSQNTGYFSLPLLNITGVKEINVFVAQGAPKRLSKTASQIASNNNITISSFSPNDINGALAGNQISVAMYVSNSSCDVPTPSDSCLVTSSANLDSFNPLTAVIGGGAISFRVGYNGIFVHYVNVDMLASGPPDGMFENDAGSSESSSSFSNAMKFGSNGPTMYDYVLISMPYVEGSTSTTGLNETLDVNLSIPVFYGQDANGNMNWTAPIWDSSNGTNATDLAANYSHYSTHRTEWQTLMQSKNCTDTESSLSSTTPCFIDKTNNRLWVRLPHFSGTAPTATGTIVTAASSSSSSSSSGSGGTTAFWINTQAITDKQFTDGFSKEMYKKYRIQVTLDKTNHYVGLISLTATTATINISSTPQQATLAIGEEKKFEITGDDYYDLLIKLNSIKDNKANVTVRKINEKIVTAAPVTETQPVAESEPVAETPSDTETNTGVPVGIWIAIIVVIIGVIVIIIAYVLMNTRKNKKYPKKVKVFDFY